jgi:hypothetical protein
MSESNSNNDTDFPKVYETRMYLFFKVRTDLEKYPQGYVLKLLASDYSGDDDDICLTPHGVTVSVPVPYISRDSLPRRAIQSLKTKQIRAKSEAYKRQQYLQRLIDKLQEKAFLKLQQDSF